MKKHWKIAAVVTAVAIVGLSVVAVASGAASVSNPFRGKGACAALAGNAKASAAMSALREEHRADMQAWQDKYGADPRSAEAQQALQTMMAEHRADMQGLCQKYGIKTSKGAGSAGCLGQGAAAGACGSRTGAGMMNGQSGGMMGGQSGGMMGGGPSGGCGADGCGSQGGSTQGSSYGGGMMGGTSY